MSLVYGADYDISGVWEELRYLWCVGRTTISLVCGEELRYHWCVGRTTISLVCGEELRCLWCGAGVTFQCVILK